MSEVCRSKLIVFFVASVLLVLSCKKEENHHCHLPIPDTFKLLSFKLETETGQSVIGESGVIYYYTEVTVTDSTNNSPERFNISRDGRVAFSVATPSDSLSIEYEKNFYIFFPANQIQNRDDIDTISTKYILHHGECDVVRYEQFEMYYNDSLYVSGGFPTSTLSILKE